MHHRVGAVRGIVFCLLGGLVLSACAPGSTTTAPAAGAQSQTQSAPAVKKRISASIRGEPATLSGIIDSSGVGGTAGLQELEEMVNVGLVELVDNRVAIRPRLAMEVPTIENGLWRAFPDGRMETTWKIRTDAKWHDGAPFTSADLLFTVRVGQDEELTVLSNNAYKFVEGVEAPDPSTVTVKWTRPFILADTMFAGNFALPIPKHILEPVYLSEKATFVEHPFWTEQFVGTGPFKVREFVHGSHTVLEAYDDYVLGRPKIDEIEVKFINDTNVIVANVLSGTVDVTIGRGLAPEQAIQAEQQWGSGKIDSAFGTSWTAIYPQFIDPNPAVLANVEFRRALMHALNRQQMVDALALGKTRVVSSWVGPNAPEFREVQADTREYSYDQRKAIEMIAALGYTKGADGMFYDSAGQPLVVEIRTTDGDKLRADAMFTSADLWKQVGVNPETMIIPRQRARDREYRVTRPAFELTHQPNELTERAMQRFMTKEIPSAPQWRGNNRARYSSPEYDVLVEKYLVTLSGRERLPIAKQIVRHISEQLPALPLMYRIDLMLISNRLVNVTAETDVRNAQEWDLK